MRVSVFCAVFPPYKGGMGAIAKQEAEMLARQGHEVTVVTPEYAHRAHAQEKEIAVVYAQPLFAFGNAAILKISPLLKYIRDTDAVHLHYPFFGTALPVVIFAKLFRKRLVVSWHMRATAPACAYIKRALFALHRVLEEPIIKMCAKYICISSIDYAKIFTLPQQKVHVVPFGVDTTRFSPGERTMRVREGIDAGCCAILFVGGMDSAHAFKGVEILLEAFARLGHDAAAVLWLVGDGNLRARYEAQARTLGIEKRVRFFGAVSFAQLPEMYRNADVHVLPSRNSAEAYGLVTAEAGASGIPSIVSNLPGVRTLVEQKETGLIVPAGDVHALYDALHFVVHHEDVRRAWGRAARSFMCAHASKAREAALLAEMFV